MKTILLIIMLAISMTAMSQTSQSVCPVISVQGIAFINTVSANEAEYNVYITYSTSPVSYTSAKWIANTGTQFISGCFDSLRGSGTKEVRIIAGLLAPVVTVTPMLDNQCLFPCSQILALANKLEYKNGMLYFKGKLYHRESRSVFNNSPFTPVLIGEYYSVDNGEYSNTVYVSKVNKQTNWIVYDAIGREVNTFILAANKVLIKESGNFYRQIK